MTLPGGSRAVLPSKHLVVTSGLWLRGDSRKPPCSATGQFPIFFPHEEHHTTETACNTKFKFSGKSLWRQVKLKHLSNYEANDKIKAISVLCFTITQRGVLRLADQPHSRVGGWVLTPGHHAQVHFQGVGRRSWLTCWPPCLTSLPWDVPSCWSHRCFSLRGSCCRSCRLSPMAIVIHTMWNETREEESM